MATQKDKDNHLDRIFHAMGELKIFTVVQALIMALYCFPSSYQLLSNVFICRDVGHRCASAPNDSSLLLSGLDGYDSNDLSISYQQCHIVISYNDTVLKKEDCIYGMEYDQARDFSVVSQFDLVCDYASLAKLSQTLVIAGQGIGAFVFTMLSDRYGRKTIMVSSNIGLLVCGTIIAMAPNYAVFAVFKFVVGTFQQGCVTTFATWFLEMLTTKNRRLQAFVAGTVWGIGSMTLAVWAYVFRYYSWRTLQLALSMGSIPFILQLWCARESLRWMIANGKSKPVVEYIRKATTLNKTSYEYTMKVYTQACDLLKDKDKEFDVVTEGQKTATKRLSLLELLRIKRLFLNASIMWLAWFTTALSFFAIYMSSTSLAGDPYLNFFLTALMEVPNNFLLYFMLNRYGRKFTLRTVYFIVSVGLIGGGIFRSFEQTQVNAVFALIFSLIAMTGASASFAFVFFYTPEIFPTNMRNQAVGLSSLMGRIGGMIAPFTGILSEKAKWAPGLMIGGCAFIVCVLSVFLPETRGKELPQTIENVKAWFSESSDDSTEISEFEDTEKTALEK